MTNPETPRISRRVAVKWMLTAMGTAALADTLPAVEAAAAGAVAATAKGYGTDPDLTKLYKPGDLWPLTLTDAQRKTVTALCDLIIPADENSPSASAVAVPDFIDEWVSAPYPEQRRDRTLVLKGLQWLDGESRKRHGRAFVDLSGDEQTAIATDICFEPKARPEMKEGARFFDRFRDLTAGGYYTTPQGMKAIGYVGNVPSGSFAGPPPEAFKHVGLA